MIYSTNLFRITEKYTNKRVWMPFTVKRQTPFFPWSPLASYGHKILSWFVNPVFFRAIVEVSLKEQTIATVILSKIFSMIRLTWHLNLIFLYTYSAYKAVIVFDSCWANDEKRQQYNAEAEEDTTCTPYSLALTSKFAPNLKLFIFFLWGPGCTKLRIEIETQLTKRNETKRNITKRNEIYLNGETKRNATKRNLL
jgi:hypothetical protein